MERSRSVDREKEEIIAPGFLSPWHIAILAIVLLVVLGPKRLPEVGRSLGKGMREFKDSITAHHDADDAGAGWLPVDTRAEQKTGSERDQV